MTLPTIEIVDSLKEPMADHCYWFYSNLREALARIAELETENTGMRLGKLSALIVKEQLDNRIAELEAQADLMAQMCEGYKSKNGRLNERVAELEKQLTDLRRKRYEELRNFAERLEVSLGTATIIDGETPFNDILDGMQDTRDEAKREMEQGQ